MEPIIDPIDRDVLLAELTPERFVRKTNNGNNEIYIVNHHNSPNVMLEIGRLRELTFRVAGGGTGHKVDIDEWDTMPNPYQQLLVWDTESKEILGGYRYYICGRTKPEDDLNLATAGLFNFSEGFISNYLPHIIELGRSFVQPDYQSTSKFRKALYALDNLWDGLGALIIDNPDKKYFFGKVTIYPDYHSKARDLVYTLMEKHFPDKEGLLIPKEPLPFEHDKTELLDILKGNTYEEDYKIASQVIRSLGVTIPPLINAYLNLSSTAKTFGTGINHHFGMVYETGLIVTLNDIYPEKKERHIKDYKGRG